jgi:hypothetical protein
MPEATTHRWKFLTNHAQVLACVAHDPGVLLREISERVGITERAAHRIVTTRSKPACRSPTASGACNGSATC